VLQSIDTIPAAATAAGVDFESLYDALDRLRELSPTDAKVFEQHAILGLTLEELSRLNGVSTGTVKRQVRRAKTWLAASLRKT
jgi:RNA polymerase sigma factor (sigma-70 family)